MKTATKAASLVSILFVVSCTSSSGTDDIGGTDDGGDTTSDTGAQSGYIALSSSSVSGVSVSAGFVDDSNATDDAGANPCTTTQVNSACIVTLCQPTDAGSGPASSAGTITIAGAETVAVGPDDTNSYSYQDDNALWHIGQRVLLSTSGADVPAFSALIPTPNFATITTPALPADPTVPLVAASSADLEVDWTGGLNANVNISLSDATYLNTVTCSFSPGAIGGVIPTAALRLLPPGPGYTLNAATSISDVTVMSGTWSIDVSASTNVLDPTGMDYNLAVTLQ